MASRVTTYIYMVSTYLDVHAYLTCVGVGGERQGEK
jgi:hypothetical protein